MSPDRYHSLVSRAHLIYANSSTENWTVVPGTYGLGRSEASYNGLDLLGCYMQRKVREDQWERKRENISVFYKTYPASRLFSSISFSLQIYFSRSSYGIGKQDRGLGSETGRVDGTRPDNFYIISLCPQIRERLGKEDVLGSYFLIWIGEIDEGILGLVSNMAHLDLLNHVWRLLKRQQRGWLART